MAQRLEQARDFLLSLKEYDRTVELINDRVGDELLSVMQAFVDRSYPAEESPVRQQMVGFMVMGYLLRSHLDRVELDEALPPSESAD